MEHPGQYKPRDPHPLDVERGMRQFLAAADGVKVAAQRRVALDEPCDQQAQKPQIDHDRKAEIADRQQAAEGVILDEYLLATGHQDGQTRADKPHRQ